MKLTSFPAQSIKRGILVPLLVLMIALTAGCGPQPADLDIPRTQVAEEFFQQQTLEAQAQPQKEPSAASEENYTPPPTPDPARIVQDGLARLEGAGFHVWATEDYSTATGEELEAWLSANQSIIDSNFQDKLLYFEPDPAEVYLVAFQSAGDQINTILTVQPYQAPSRLSSQDFLEGILNRLPAHVEILDRKIYSYRGAIFPQASIRWKEDNIQQQLLVRTYDDQQYFFIFTSSPENPLIDPQSTAAIAGSFMREAPLTQPPIAIGEKSTKWQWIAGENIQILVPPRIFGSHPGEQLANYLQDFPPEVTQRADRVQNHSAGIDLWAFDPSSEIELLVRGFIPAAPEPIDEEMEAYLDSRTGEQAELLMSEVNLTSLEEQREVIREVFQDQIGITVRYYKPRKGLIGGINTQPGFNMHCFLSAEDLEDWLPILDEIALSWQVVSND